MKSWLRTTPMIPTWRATSTTENRYETRRCRSCAVPFPGQAGGKIRPAVVVQGDAENQRLANTILAMITGNLNDAGQPTTVLVDPQTGAGAGSGLNGPSLVKGCNL